MALLTLALSPERTLFGARILRESYYLGSMLGIPNSRKPPPLMYMYPQKKHRTLITP